MANPANASGAFRSGPRAPTEAVAPLIQNAKLTYLTYFSYLLQSECFDGEERAPKETGRRITQEDSREKGPLENLGRWEDPAVLRANDKPAGA
jgi:hypothetical protein